MPNGRILIVDDADAIRDMLGSFLTGLGYSTDLASDGQVAFERFRTQPYDMIICDLQMPRMEGLTLLALVKAIDPHVPVIILTGHATLETAIEALRLGAYDYQFKPVENMEIFGRLVERALNHRRLLVENQRLVQELQQANARLESEVAERTHALQVANESLRGLDRLKNDFIAVVSHELRTPLAVITMDAQLLTNERQALPLTRLEEIFHGLLVNARRLQMQIDDLLDFALIERGELDLKFKPCWVNQIVRDVIDLYSVRAEEKSVKMTLNLPPTAKLAVIADGPRLRSALIHLVDNAIKFTAVGGTVNVSIHSLVNVPDTLTPAVAFVVQDTGIGLTPEVQRNLFTAFNQADMSTTRRYGGMGMGLALAQRIIEAHGGKLTFHSEPGNGSLFAMWIPTRQPEQ
jgi:two-component system, sensor histidine kinase